MKKLIVFLTLLSVALVINPSNASNGDDDSKDKLIPPPRAIVTLNGFDDTNCVIDKITLTYYDPIFGKYVTEEKNANGATSMGFALPEPCDGYYCGNLTAGVVVHDCDDNTVIIGDAYTSVTVYPGNEVYLEVEAQAGSEL